MFRAINVAANRLGAPDRVDGDEPGELPESDWIRAHQALSRLARERATADAEEGRWLLTALRSAAHARLGFASFTEYVERSFGHKPRSTQEKLRVAEALEGLPIIARALEDGSIHWSAARELTRVAVSSNEAEWLEFAKRKSVRELETVVSGKRPGDTPNATSVPVARRHVLRFEVSAETFAMFREAIQQLRRSTNSPLDDDAVLLELARHVLGGPHDEGRSSYQITIGVCSECGRGAQLAAGGRVSVSPEVVAMAHCDGQHIGGIARPANDNPSITDRGAHVGAKEQSKTPGECVSRVTRAKQTIPPALRRQVLHRDQRSCRVPGCRNARFLDLHHIQPRSEGGPNRPDNLVVLCGAHHRAAHRGALIVEQSDMGVSFRHADGAAYGHNVSSRILDTHAKVFAGLRHLGFRETDVRRVLDRLREHPASGTAEGLLRESLAWLTGPRDRAENDQR